MLSLHCVRSPDVERNDRVPYITKAQKTVTNPANQINHSYVEVCVVCASRRKQHVMLLLIGCMLTKLNGMRFLSQSQSVLMHNQGKYRQISSDAQLKPMF